jgi:serine phosphatase RsbU (regulator of sigma subunit)/HAMP domain-containing protein
MRSAGRTSASLAVQIIRLTFAVGLVTVVAASALAIAGTSQLVANSVAAGNLETLQVIDNALLGRLAESQLVAASVGEFVSESKTHAQVASRLASSYPASAPLIKSVIVLAPNSKIIAAVPSTIQTIPPGALHAASIAVLGGSSLDISSGEGVGTGALWLSEKFVTESGLPEVVLLSLNTDYIRRVISEAAKDGRSVYLLQNGVAEFTSGVEGVEFANATWSPGGPNSGTLRVGSGRGSTLSGHYSDVTGINGVSWRLVVVEPVSAVVRGTFAAMWPTLLVVALGGIAALLMAWLVTRRLVRPLRDLESAARRGAGGAYVEPIEYARSDEIGRVAEAFNAVALRLNALHDLAQLLASSSRVDQVLDGILSAMEHIVGSGVTAIYLLDEGGRWLVPAAVHGADLGTTPAIDAWKETWLSGVLGGGEPASFIPGGRTLAEELPGLATSEGGALAAPLVWSGETLGVVVVLRPVDVTASEAESEMVRTFSAQAAVAVHNSRLFSVETESRRVSEGLRAVAERLVRAGGLRSALLDVESIVADLFKARSATFAIIDRAALGLPPASNRVAEREMLAFALRATAKNESGRPFLVHPGIDQGADEVMGLLGATELLVAPIALESDHGALLMIAFDQDRATKRDVDLAEAVGNEIALSFDNAFFYQQALTRAANLETVFRISQVVGSSLEVKVVLDRVLDVVQKILSADAVALITYDARKRTLRTEMARGAVSPTMVERVMEPGDDVVGYVFESGEPVAFRDMHDGMAGIAGDAARHGLRSMLAVPLMARGRAIGVLTVFSAVEGSFTDEDMNILQTFASQASIAIDTARLYSHEHEVASVLQRSILPGALPHFAELEAASVYEPAGGEAEIGGDYYDVFRAPDATIWLAIADVCGKGVVAATKTSMIKYAVRAFVAAGFSPGRVIGEINRMVAEGGDPSDIVTLWLGRIDVGNGRVMWAGGGHPAGLLRSAQTGQVAHLSATGPLLGAMASVTYTDESTVIGPGDTLLLYTDGVTEARSGNTFFGEDNVERALNPGGDADEVVERLIAAVRRFVQTDFRDDVAVLAVRILPK